MATQREEALEKWRRRRGVHVRAERRRRCWADLLPHYLNFQVYQMVSRSSRASEQKLAHGGNEERDGQREAAHQGPHARIQQSCGRRTSRRNFLEITTAQMALGTCNGRPAFHLSHLEPSIYSHEQRQNRSAANHRPGRPGHRVPRPDVDLPSPASSTMRYTRRVYLARRRRATPNKLTFEVQQSTSATTGFAPWP